jgi:hypothetical protein
MTISDWRLSGRAIRSARMDRIQTAAFMGFHFSERRLCQRASSIGGVYHGMFLVKEINLRKKKRVRQTVIQGRDAPADPRTCASCCLTVFTLAEFIHRDANSSAMRTILDSGTHVSKREENSR